MISAGVDRQVRRLWLGPIVTVGAVALALLLAVGWRSAPAAEAPTKDQPGTFLVQAVSKPPQGVTFRTGSVLPADHPVTQLLKKWGEILAQKTGGALNVEVHSGGVLGTTRTGPEGVQMGTIESFYADPGEFSSYNRALTLLSAPYVFEDPAHLMKAVRRADIVDPLFKPVIEKGIRPLALGYHGTRGLHTKSIAARTPEDLKGQKIRVPDNPILRDMIAAWGAAPTPVPQAEIFTSLQSGLVAGGENALVTILSAKFYEVQKYIVLTNHVRQCTSIIINERFFQQQSKEHQKVLQESANEAWDWFLTLLSAEEGKAIDRLKSLGMVAVEPDRQAFRAAVRGLYEKYDPIWGKEMRERIASIK